MTGNWLLHVDEHRCVGSGVCASTAPGHFTIGENRRSRPTAVEVAADERILDAASICPMEAISVVESAGGSALFPEEEGGG